MSRTKEEIDKEYSQHALFAGHKQALAMDLENQVRSLSGEVDTHITAMNALRREAATLAPLSAVEEKKAE